MLGHNNPNNAAHVDLPDLNAKVHPEAFGAPIDAHALHAPAKLQAKAASNRA
jgi:hypothetical protein